MNEEPQFDVSNRCIGARLRLAREQHQLTATEVAADTGLSLSRLGELEDGAGDILAAELSLLAETLELPVAFFLQEDPRRNWTGEWQLLYSFRMLSPEQQHDVLGIVDEMVGQVRVTNRS